MHFRFSFFAGLFEHVIFSWLNFLTLIEAANILAIFPTPSKSHFLFNEAVARSLYDAGHDVTIVSPFAEHELMKNYTAIDSRRGPVLDDDRIPLRKMKEISVLKLLERVIDKEAMYCRDILQISEIQKLLHSFNKEFDLMILEVVLMYECFLPLAEKVGIPVIGTMAVRSGRMPDWAIGNPYNPAVLPAESSEFSDRMIFLQRVKSTLHHLAIQFCYWFMVMPQLSKIYNEFYTSDLLHRKKVSLVFYNNHATFLSRPLVPNAFDIGGIHVKPAKPLPQDLQNFMDGAEYGVIVFAVGSLTKNNSMPPEIKLAFKDAFAQIPQRVIWKFDEPMEDISDNIWIVQWIPQRDVLAHKKVIAFITHCGMTSTYEAIHEGVPLVMAPLFLDQKSNAAFLRQLQVGVDLDVFKVNAWTILEALNSVVNDSRYFENMQRLSQTFKDRPMTPQETVVYWTEYVIRNGGAMYLRTVSADMPLYQYLLLDVILFLFLTTMTAAYIILRLFRRFYGFCSQYLLKRRMTIRIGGNIVRIGGKRT